ncbi:MAG: nuclear transport factor 2 family protein [Bacteroidia bacterium]|nr:nuclear transport factor 2 family protein [Bacteroidia bacterium]
MLSQAEKQNIQLVWDGMGAILETKDEEVVEKSFAKDFIQHNPWAKDGIEHIKEMLQFDFGYKAVRWISDEDIMVYHGYYTAPNPLGDLPLLCVDMWRVEDGKIKEHWDALAPMPQDQLEKAIAGGGDGEKAVSAEKVAANKQGVKRFLDHVLNRGRIDQLKEFVSSEYIYHHETEGELKGHADLEEHIVKKHGGRMLHDNKALLASGDLVMAHSHFFGEEERVVFDWFRMDETSKILEHWSVVQPITPLEEVANVHPHF